MNKIHKTNGRRFFFGFILILIGLVMILERSGVLSWEVYDFLLSWKMLLVAIGALIFFSGNKGAGVIVMGIGTFFMLPDIFDDYIEIKRYFWPALLLLAGLSFMFSRRGPHRNNGNEREYVAGESDETNSGSYSSNSSSYNNNSSSFDNDRQKSYGQPFNSYSARVDRDYFDEFVMFGGRDLNLYSNNLQGGKSTAIFGGVDIDLRKCQISPLGCTIEVTTLFGANSIKVPNDWTVLNKVTTIFGGYSDLRIKDPLYAPNPSKTIVVTGVCLFGSTEITNFIKAH